MRNELNFPGLLRVALRLVVVAMCVAFPLKADTLQWEASSGVAGYNVYIMSNGRLVKKVATVGTRYSLDSLPRGTYAIYATSYWNNGIESVSSNQIVYRKRH